MKGITPNIMKKSFFITANPILTKEIAMKIGSIINNFWNVPNIPAFESFRLP